MVTEDGIPIESMPPEPGDIICESGLRIAVVKKDERVILMFSRPIYFAALTRQQCDKLIVELGKYNGLLGIDK